MTRDQADKLKLQLARDLRYGCPISPAMREWGAALLESQVKGLPPPGVNGRAPKVKRSKALDMVVAEMERRGGTHTFQDAVRAVAGELEVHDDTIVRAVRRSELDWDRLLELQLLIL